MNATPSSPSHLHVIGTGYVCVNGWSLSFDPLPSPACIVFTHENLSALRADDFHIKLLKTVRKSYRNMLEWKPVTS